MESRPRLDSRAPRRARALGESMVTRWRVGGELEVSDVSVADSDTRFRRQAARDRNFLARSKPERLNPVAGYRWMSQLGAGCVKTLMGSGAPPIFEACALPKRDKIAKILALRGYMDSLAEFSHMSDVYGPRPIATDFGRLWFKVTTADVYPASLRGLIDSLPRASMDFRALPPQRRQGIGRSHAGPDTRFGKRRR